MSRTASNGPSRSTGWVDSLQKPLEVVVDQVVQMDIVGQVGYFLVQAGVGMAEVFDCGGAAFEIQVDGHDESVVVVVVHGNRVGFESGRASWRERVGGG